MYDSAGAVIHGAPIGLGGVEMRAARPDLGLRLALFEQPILCGLDVEELCGGSPVIDIRKGQEGDVAALAEVAIDLVAQLLLIVDREDE